VGLEPALAALVTLVGVALTSVAVFTHAGPLVAPGAVLTLVGGAWLGNSLARRPRPSSGTAK
jgi:hypothetical protein